MTVLRIGIATAAEYKARTLAIARGELRPKADAPKLWFTSLDSLAKLLSEPNRELLALIAREKPDSLQALAGRTGRAKSNLSRTLRTMASYGLVTFEPGPRRTVAPRVAFDHIRLDLPMARQLAA